MESNLDTCYSILVSTLGKRFNREWIFRNLTVEFTSPNTYAITGPNGSGKSTLLQVLWGQMPPSTGNIKYATGESEIAIEKAYQHLAIATPYLDLIEEFTLKEQLEFHFALKKPRNGLRITDILEKMELSHAKDKAISNFSSGMKQRTKLAMAFYTAVDALFLDEPGTNLDTKAFDWYKTSLAELLGKQLIFIASNQPEEYPQNAIKIDIMDFK